MRWSGEHRTLSVCLSLSLGSLTLPAASSARLCLPSSESTSSNASLSISSLFLWSWSTSVTSLPRFHLSRLKLILVSLHVSGHGLAHHSRHYARCVHSDGQSGAARSRVRSAQADRQFLDPLSQGIEGLGLLSSDPLWNTETDLSLPYGDIPGIGACFSATRRVPLSPESSLTSFSSSPTPLADHILSIW